MRLNSVSQEEMQMKSQQEAQFELIDMINNKLAKIKTNNELLIAGSPLAKELVYSMKVNFWMHDDP